MTKTKKTVLASGIIALILAASMLFLYLLGGLRVSAEELSKSYKREMEPTSYTDAFKTNAAEFSFALYRAAMAQNGENSLLSPLSALYVLGMLSMGADGETLTQIEQAVGMDKDALASCLAALEVSLEGSKSGGIHLENSIWIRDTFKNSVKAAFLQSNADYFGAQIYAAPFDATTVRDVNRWVEYYTDGMIDKILEEAPDPLSVMYLINTLALDFKWDTAYKKNDIISLPFHSTLGEVQNATGLVSSESVYLSAENLQGIAKPYANGDFYFVALLPEEGTSPEALLSSLNGASWNALWNGKRNQTVEVTLPEFTYDREMQLNEALGKLGILDLFDSQKANLSNLSESPLHCSFIKQKTLIDVSREGTKAAAVTVGAVKCMSAAPGMALVFDRPFAYAIVDAQSGLPLFLGAVNSIH